jgi:hypothetical protein
MDESSIVQCSEYIDSEMCVTHGKSLSCIWSEEMCTREEPSLLPNCVLYGEASSSSDCAALSSEKGGCFYNGDGVCADAVDVTSCQNLKVSDLCISATVSLYPNLIAGDPAQEPSSSLAICDWDSQLGACSSKNGDENENNIDNENSSSTDEGWNTTLFVVILIVVVVVVLCIVVAAVGAFIYYRRKRSQSENQQEEGMRTPAEINFTERSFNVGKNMEAPHQGLEDGKKMESDEKYVEK